MGRDKTKRHAAWFAGVYDRAGFRENWEQRGRTTHLRRMHYALLGTRGPDGAAFENTVECWWTLCMASLGARYLGLVDVAAIEDHRIGAAQVYALADADDGTITVRHHMWTGLLDLPDFPGTPSLELSGYESNQRYLLEVWVEKSTVEDILKPVCRRYDANLQVGMGEFSLSSAFALVRRMREAGKPTRILYLSDFDPAGQSMPVALARKVEFFVRQAGAELDVRIFPLLLNADQIRHYQLPRLPVKKTEKRAGKFAERFGVDEDGGLGTELDALVALRPGELERIVGDALRAYYDTTLAERTREQEAEIEEAMAAVEDEVLENHDDEIARLRLEYEIIQREFGERIRDVQGRIGRKWATIAEEMSLAAPDLEDYPVPEADEATEIAEGLYESRRDYLAQLDAYKRFQGEPTLAALSPRRGPVPAAARAKAEEAARAEAEAREQHRLDIRERIVQTVRDHPEWKHPRVAAACGASRPLVSKVVRQMKAAGDL